jgi:hypothetical protein
MRSLFDIPHPGTGTPIRPANAGFTDWEYEPAVSRWTLHSFNEVGHLLSLDYEG